MMKITSIRSPLFRLFLLILFLSGFSTPALIGQTRPALKPMGIPEHFIVPVLGNDFVEEINFIPGTVWTVYSDRDQTVGIKKEGGAEVKVHLQFLDRFFVVDEQKGLIHLLRDDKFDRDRVKFSSGMVDLGWVDKKNFLLWKHCLVDSTNTRNVQVVTLSDSGSPEMNLDGSSDDGIQVFSDPALKTKAKVKSQANQIYFVYKITENALLVGSERKIQGDSTAGRTILGWVARHHCYMLENKFWMSSQLYDEAVEGQPGILPCIFVDEMHAREFLREKPVSETFVLWKGGNRESAAPGTLKFPLLADMDSLAKVKLIGEDFINGYAVVKCRKCPVPLFSKVILASNFEINGQLFSMQKIVEAASGPDKRNALRNMLIKMVSSEYDGLDEQKIRNLTLKEALTSLFLVCQSDLPLLQKKIRRLDEEEEIPEVSLNEMVALMREKIVGLQRLINIGQDEHSFISNDIRYYWVDLNLLF